MFTVDLRARRNPDFPPRDLPPRCRVVVTNLSEASQACLQFIEEHDLGGSEWSGGEVLDAATGKVVALVSYNGRVWSPGEDRTKRTEFVVG